MTAAPAATATRDAAAVTAWNLVSRLTGLARIVVLGGALGATRLGDTFQGTNQVSNVLFELLAAGTLSAVLVPGLVARLVQVDVDDAQAFAGVVLGRVLLVLAPVVALGLVLRAPATELLFAGAPDAGGGSQTRLAAFLAVFVFPQLLLYAWGAVTTALLHASGRFVAAAAAPIANNAVSILGLAWFWHRGASGLQLRAFDQWLLGLTAFGGVLAMTVVPLVAARRAGLWVVPRFSGEPRTTQLARDAGWGALVLIPAQLVALASLVVASRAPGAFAAYQIAFSFFLLPHALVGHPAATVLFPRIATAWAAGAQERVRALGASGLQFTTFVLVVAAALTVALAPWLVRIAAIGALGEGGGDDVTAVALRVLALGLPAYAWTLLLTRVAYATGDLRLPAVAAVAGAAVAMGALGFATQRDARTSVVAWTAGAHTAMVLVSASVMVTALLRRGVVSVHVARTGGYLVAAVFAGATAAAVAAALPDAGGRVAAVVVAAVAATAGVVVYVIGVWAAGQRSLPRLGAP